jgi:UDP-N-acetylenolpyruvoylglucosamine reductase
MQMSPHIIEELSGYVSPDTVIRLDEAMVKHTTLRVGGPADLYAEPSSETDLSALLDFCRKRGLKFFVLGRGSNLLVRDGGFRGMIICLSQPEFSRIEIVGKQVRCGAGARLKLVAVEAKRHGLSGLEFLEGIPGSVGGALRMNAGAMGSATFDAVVSVRVMDYDGNVKEISAADMQVEYRCCATLKDKLALEVLFKCEPGDPEQIQARMKAYSEKRWSSQPAAASAGCMFKNPRDIPAGRLIDELGLKGTRIGGALISQEHGNFLVNDGGATARDVLSLIGLLQTKAQTVRGVELHTEIEVIGDDSVAAK